MKDSLSPKQNTLWFMTVLLQTLMLVSGLFVAAMIATKNYCVGVIGAVVFVVCLVGSFITRKMFMMS